jgi:rhodanese-related sulfurtransferase
MNNRETERKEFKTKLYREFARVGSALASDTRLFLLDMLAQGPRNVDALAAQAGMSVANVSQHLQVLRNAKLVDSEKMGTRVVYRLTDDSVLRLWLMLRTVAEEHLPEVQLIRQEYTLEGLGDEVTRDDVDRLLAANRALLIDVRPREEFENGHLPGALAIPVEELEERLVDLPQDKQIIAYCRGSFCLFADEAVAFLLSKGFSATRLDGGWPEWLNEERETEH